MIELSQFHFLRPLWLLVLPILGTLWWLARSRSLGRVRSLPLLSSHLQTALTLHQSNSTVFHPVDAQALAALLLVFAAAGPSWSREPSPWVSETAPLVAAIEVSDSMRANDLTPNRLARARFKLLDLLEQRTGARTALIAYAGSAHIVLPLSSDLNAIQPLLESLDPQVMPKPGASARAVLEPALKLLGDSASKGTILYLTDGFDALDIDPIREFSAKRSNPALVGLLVGTEEGGSALLPDGTPARDEDSSRVDTSIDTAVLQRIEREAELPVVRLSSDGGDVRKLLRYIESNQAYADDPDARWRDQGWWLLFPAAGLILLGFRRGWTTTRS
ncbi:MAG: VWA domain-containing protein [Pseudomonadota bacterium]